MLEYSYKDLDDGIEFFFVNHKGSTIYSSENSYFYAENDEEPDMFLHHLKVIVHETKHNILTDRMRDDFIQYAERWDKGEFRPELIPDDILIIQADIDFVRSALIL